MHVDIGCRSKLLYLETLRVVHAFIALGTQDICIQPQSGTTGSGKNSTTLAQRSLLGVPQASADSASPKIDDLEIDATGDNRNSTASTASTTQGKRHQPSRNSICTLKLG